MKKSEALKILGLSQGANEDQIKKAHRKLVIENHPDKFGQDEKARAQAEEKTKLINEARDVLLSGRWEPESATAGTPYGAPFTYNPYSQRPQSQPHPNSGTNPFEGWPFEGSFVWTTWDAQGNRHTYTSGQPSDSDNPFTGQNPFTIPFVGGNPFARPTSPFDFNPFSEPVAPEERLRHEKKMLKEDLSFIGIKALILLLFCLLSMPAMGLYLYAILSIGQGIYKRLSFISIFFIAPLLLLALIFAPAAHGTVGILVGLLFVASVGFDISNLRRRFHVIDTLKKKIPNKKKN